MIERQVIQGRHATVVYTRGFDPVDDPDDADLIKVIFDDGEQLFLTPPGAEKGFDPTQPRDDRGRWSETGSGWSKGPRKEWPEHIQQLGVPPGWKDVHYNDNPDGPLLVVGRDAKGRLQYMYSQKHIDQQAAAKFARIGELDKKFGSIQRQVEKDRKSSDPVTAEHANVTTLIMETGMRPGSTRDTGGETPAYGATTLLGKHVKVSGKSVELSFTGKHGVQQNITIKGTLATVLKRQARAAGRNGTLFPNVTQGSLLSYISELDGGGFKSKDFRTLTGTRTARQTISGMPKPTNMTAYKKSVRSVAVAVSSKLGNTPTVALQSYINPTVFAEWRHSAGV